MEKVPATGIIGTVLGATGTVLGVASGGLGLLNGNKGGGHGCEADRLRAELATERAERYADRIGAEAVKASAEARLADFKSLQVQLDAQNSRFSSQLKDALDEVVRQGKEEVRTAEQLKCAEKISALEHAALQKEIDCKVDALRAETKLGFQQVASDLACESERRAAGDANIREWTSCTFVPYKKVVDADMICPKVQLASTTTNTPAAG